MHSPKRQSIRVMTFNIHKGLDLFGRKSVLEILKNAMQELGPDLVFLQEVMGHASTLHRNSRGLTTSQFEYLADSVWPHFAYGKNAIYSSGNHGNAILSQFPIVFHENVDISTNRFERRGLLHAEIQINEHNQNLHLLCLHLNLFENGRRQQMARIVERAQRKIPAESALILAGDFNDWRSQMTDRLLSELSLHEAALEINGQHARTFPAFYPLLPLDRIYFRGLTVQDCQILHNQPWASLSDHMALVANFTF